MYWFKTVHFTKRNTVHLLLNIIYYFIPHKHFTFFKNRFKVIFWRTFNHIYDGDKSLALWNIIGQKIVQRPWRLFDSKDYDAQRLLFYYMIIVISWSHYFSQIVRYWAAVAAPMRRSSFLCVRMTSKLDWSRFCCSWTRFCKVRTHRIRARRRYIVTWT